MQVAFASGSGSHWSNEDWVAATPDALVLLDGLSTPPGFDTGCIHNTQWYVRSLGTVLLRLLTTDSGQPIASCLAQSIAQVADLHTDTCDLSHIGTPSATVAILRTGPPNVQYLVLSDALVVLDTHDGIQVITDPSVNHAAANERNALLRERIGTPGHTERKTEMVAAQRKLRNVPGGYWIAAATPEAAQHSLIGEVACDNIRRAAVLSDGAASLVEYELVTWAGLLDLLEEHGPLELIRRIRAAEASDPYGERWPRYKTGDDATAAVCLFGPP